MAKSVCNSLSYKFHVKVFQAHTHNSKLDKHRFKTLKLIHIIITSQFLCIGVKLCLSPHGKNVQCLVTERRGRYLEVLERKYLTR